MTPDNVYARVDAIRACAGDYELAHGAEDELHQDVLRHIASGNAENPARLAHLALKTTEIAFARYYA